MAVRAPDGPAVAGPSRLPQTTAAGPAASQGADIAPLPRENILLLGLRRSGKSSIVHVVYKSLAPDDSLFLESTLRCKASDIDTFQPMRIWDGTGAELESAMLGQGQPPPPQQQHQQPASSVADKARNGTRGQLQSNVGGQEAGRPSGQGVNAASPSSKGKTACGTNGQLHWIDCGAVVFVIDSQDEWYDAIDRLHDIIIDAYASNPLIHFHIFVHKVDGHSTDYRYDTLQQIERRVADNLAEASPSFIFAPTAYAIMAESVAALDGRREGNPNAYDEDEEDRERNRSRWSAMRQGQGNAAASVMNESAITAGQPSSFGPDLERDVRLFYHATSIYNPDIYVACSRVQIGLMHVDVRKTLDTLCDGLCSSCKFEKVYLFDVPTKTYIAADSSPYDENNFEAISEYLTFLVQFSGLYRSLGYKKTADGAVQSAQLPAQINGDISADTPRYTASAVRLSSDTTLGFHQVNTHLALAFVVRTDIHTKRAGMIDFNIAIARKAIIDVYEECNA